MAYTYDSILEIAKEYEAAADKSREGGFTMDQENLERRAIALRMLAQTCLYAPGGELSAHTEFLIERAKGLDLYPDRTED